MTTPGHGLPAWLKELNRYSWTIYEPLTTLGALDEAGDWVKWADLVAACPPRLLENKEDHTRMASEVNPETPLTATASESHSTGPEDEADYQARALWARISGNGPWGQDEQAIQAIAWMFRTFEQSGAMEAQKRAAPKVIAPFHLHILSLFCDEHGESLVKVMCPACEAAALPGAVPARSAQDQENKDLQARRGKPEQQP